MNAELVRGGCRIAAVTAQGFADAFFLLACKRPVIADNLNGRSFRDDLGQFGYGNLCSRAQDKGPFYDILQLTDIPREVIGQQKVKSI